MGNISNRKCTGNCYSTLNLTLGEKLYQQHRYSDAFECYKKASKCNCPSAVTATTKLGYFYELGLCPKLDLVKAKAYYTKTYHLGDVCACKALGDILVNELNDKDALIAYYHGAKCKDIDCLKKLLKIHTSSFKRIEPYEEHLIPFALEEAHKGDADLQHLMGCVNWSGLVNKSDSKTAFDLFTKAADQNHVDAQYNLGYMYEHGLGCDINFNKALELYKKALANRHKDAEDSINYLENVIDAVRRMPN